jgi:hypothetical protein
LSDAFDRARETRVWPFIGGSRRPAPRGLFYLTRNPIKFGGPGGYAGFR